MSSANIALAAPRTCRHPHLTHSRCGRDVWQTRAGNDPPGTATARPKRYCTIASPGTARRWSASPVLDISTSAAMPLRELLFGRPLRTEEQEGEKIGPLRGIP